MDVKELVKKITDYKKQWTDANSAGTDTSVIESNAKKVYDQMYQSGYAKEADKLAKSDYATALKMQDAYYTDGLQPTRDYVTNKLKTYGYSVNPDNFIYDEGNDNVSFKGVNLGQADYVSSAGKSYYDTQKLDGGIQNVIKNLGITRNDKSAYNQERDNLYSKYNESFDMAKNTNPFETAIGKSILERYGIKGDNAADSEIASGSSSNSGNIDSFSAANAKRQQLAYKSAGDQTVLADHNSRLANINNILNSLGMNIQNTFNNSETTLNNKVARDVSIMGSTGDVLPEYSANPYINANFDIQARINELSKDPVKNANEINLLKEARAVKIKNSTDPNINSLSFDTYNPTQKETGALRLGKYQTDAQKELTKAQLDSNERVAALNARTQTDIAQLGTDKKINDNTIKNNTELTKVYDTHAKNINNMYKDDAETDVIISQGNGNYIINPKLEKSSWVDLIIKQTGMNNALSDDEALKFLYSLGITEQDIQRVANYLKD